MTRTEKAPLQKWPDELVTAALDLHRRPHPRIIAELRHAARDFARSHGADQRCAEDVELAVSEAVTNAVKYAYAAGETGIVGLIGSVANGFLEIEVSDQGHGFQGGRSGGLGLGLTIMAQVAAYLTISQGERGTKLQMRFPLPVSE
jgi:anti-sigma regulatory factor (Ser/Thr protein kinase)